VNKSELYILLGAAVVAYFVYGKSSGSPSAPATPASASNATYQGLTPLLGNIGLYDTPVDVTSSLSSDIIPSYAAPSFPLLPARNLVLGDPGAN